MAKVTVAGNSFVVTSAVAKADLELVKKYRPSALTRMDPDTGKIFFMVAVGISSLSDYGISFDGVSNCERKLATATFPMPSDVEDAKKFVLDTAGPALAHLNRIEDALAGVLTEIRTQHSDILESITVVA